MVEHKKEVKQTRPLAIRLGFLLDQVITIKTVSLKV